jgi:hypothetical protein
LGWIVGDNRADAIPNGIEMMIPMLTNVRSTTPLRVRANSCVAANTIY